MDGPARFGFVQRVPLHIRRDQRGPADDQPNLKWERRVFGQAEQVVQTEPGRG
jgi:hypothetical protein